MATIPRGPGANTRRAEMMRKAWSRIERHGGTVLEPIWAYLTAHPTLAQGVYYLVMGLWPVFALDSFVGATGPKTDLWLVKMVGAVTAVVGATLCLAAYRRRVSLEILVLAVGCASVFALAELIFVLQRTISAIYLLDVATEVGLLALWAFAWSHGRLPWSADRPAALPVAAPLTNLPPTSVAPNGVPYR